MLSLRPLLAGTWLHPPARALRRLLLGRPDRKDVAFYRAQLPAGGLAFDIGANVGDITEPMLRAGSRVVAVEPHPRCASALQARCGGYPGFELVTAAVTAAPGAATLFLHGHPASSSLHRDWYGPPTGEVEVPGVTLAELIGRWGIPDYCKVDVEGSEAEVFATLPGRLPLVSFEYVAAAHARTEHCMRLLDPEGEASANVAVTGPSRFLLPAWIPAGELLCALPGWIQEGVLPGWGDIWVRAPGGRG
jgi:FkbM family methyltransferase